MNVRGALSFASGTGKYWAKSSKTIRFVRHGCTNRPFFHVVVMETHKDQYQPVIEQLGSYDPYVNEHNEKLVSLNFERIRFWIGKGAKVSRPVEELFGLSGFFPVHPISYMSAWRNRQKSEKATIDSSSNNSDIK